MENLEWFAVPYNGLETNVEVTKCGKVRRVKKNWIINNSKTGEINFNLLKLNNKGYRVISIQVKELKHKTVCLQQLIAATFLCYEFKYMQNVVMHLDDNPLNNCLSNLKVDTNRENLSQAKTKKSGLPVGVSWDKRAKKYKSQIQINKKITYLGLFNLIEEASKVYQTKLLELTNPA